jgi:hypothetical protein
MMLMNLLKRQLHDLDAGAPATDAAPSSPNLVAEQPDADVAQHPHLTSPKPPPSVVSEQPPPPSLLPVCLVGDNHDEDLSFEEQTP